MVSRRPRLALLDRRRRWSIGAILAVIATGRRVPGQGRRAPLPEGQLSAVPRRRSTGSWPSASPSRVAGREPFAESYHYASLAARLRRAHRRRPRSSSPTRPGCGPLAGPARARVTDRAGWVQRQHRVVPAPAAPVTDKLERAPRPERAAPPSRRSSPGAEVGTLLGWMSTRVLGQYDLLVIEDETPTTRTSSTTSGPNVLALEKRFAFPPREFRLWLALHEVTHRAQFTGVPWMRPYFLRSSSRPSTRSTPTRSGSSTRWRARRPRRRDGAEPARRRRARGAARDATSSATVLDQVGGLMSLLEGHGDVTMDRAGADRIPSAERFARVLRQRRAVEPRAWPGCCSG